MITVIWNTWLVCLIVIWIHGSFANRNECIFLDICLPMIDLDVGMFSMPESTGTKTDDRKEESNKLFNLGRPNSQHGSEITKITWS